jgi:uncharacterized coiled-coil DUF342 family protein
MTKKKRDEVNEELLSLNEEIADLKARLKAIRDATRYHEHGDGILEHHERVIKYATTLRMKFWKEKL